MTTRLFCTGKATLHRGAKGPEWSVDFLSRSWMLHPQIHNKFLFTHRLALMERWITTLQTYNLRNIRIRWKRLMINKRSETKIKIGNLLTLKPKHNQRLIIKTSRSMNNNQNEETQFVQAKHKKENNVFPPCPWCMLNFFHIFYSIKTKPPKTPISSIQHTRSVGVSRRCHLPSQHNTIVILISICLLVYVRQSRGPAAAVFRARTRIKII